MLNIKLGMRNRRWMLDRGRWGVGPAGDTDVRSLQHECGIENSEPDEVFKGTRMKTEQKGFHHDVDRVLECQDMLDLGKDQQR